MLRVVRTFALAFTLVTAGSAQTLWVVDAGNGPGANFTDIPPAVAAASPGDVLLVRSGLYSTFVVDKALTIVGQSGPSLATVLGTGTAVTVKDLPVGADVVIRNLGLDCNRLFDVTDNQGRVLIDQCLGVVNFLRPTQIVDSAQVVLNRCDLRGAVKVAGSSVMIAGGAFTGGLLGGLAEAGIQAVDSEVFVANASVRGGDGAFGQPGGPGISMSNSAITVAGDGSVSIDAGRPGVLSTITVGAIVGDGPLTLDPDVPLVPNTGAPAVSGGVAVTQQELAFLTGLGGDLGGTAHVDIHGEIGDSYSLIVGRPGPALVLPGLGVLWLDPSLLVVVAAGTIGATGQEAFQFSVPNSLAVLGVSLHWAGVTLGSSVRLTNMVGFAIGSS